MATAIRLVSLLKTLVTLLLISSFVFLNTGLVRPQIEQDSEKVLMKIDFHQKITDLGMKLENEDDFFDCAYSFYQEGMDMDLMIAQMYCESRGLSGAIGAAKERGLFQFMRKTAKGVTESIGLTYHDGIEHDPLFSLMLYHYHMQDNLAHYDNNIQLALLAYNCGTPTIDYLLSHGKSVAQIKKLIYAPRKWQPYDDKVGLVYAKLTNVA